GWYGRAIEHLTRVLARVPQDARGREYLCKAHWLRAAAFYNLERPAEALPDWDAALALDDGTAQAPLRKGRGAPLRGLGAAYEQVAEVTAPALAAGADGPARHRAAVVFAFASAARSDNPKLAESYARQAIEQLHRSTPGRDPRAAQRLRDDPDLEPL